MNYNRKRSLSKFFSKLDIRVLLVFIILILMAFFFFFFQYYRHIDCRQVYFTIEAERKQVGEIIGFKDQTPNARSWKWDFGDKTEKRFEKDPLHKYEKPGVYTITLEVNGSCVFQRILEIRDLGRLVDSTKIPKIIAPTVVEVGQNIEFYYKYRGEAFSWEWSFGETGQLDNTSEFPVYSYSTPGIKRVTFVINGDVTHISSKDIFVKPRKLINTKIKDTAYTVEKAAELFTLPKGTPQKDPMEEFMRYIPGVPLETPVQKKIREIEENKAPDISENQFQLLLLDVAKQSKTKEDFSKYTCGNYEFPVIKNNKTIMRFSEFCENIQNKKIKIESLRLTRNNKNCIEGFTIKYKVKKGFIWIYD
ncbi:PKD domain-containing protein [Apibacter raozihei]|uniref:PKD domain-containing protein n=1 Tax=Apibacter raozihei TaxID=2500547 RepID=UPI000FE2FC76|nr:PKD domain-containing protein [Apibacter raozihei]